MHAAFAHLPPRFPSSPRAFRTMPKSKASADTKSSQPPAKRRKNLGIAASVLAAEKRMSDILLSHTFTTPVTHVYNPLEYAWSAHEWYVNRYANTTKKLVLVGMNPGPWGMAQTGVPFGEVNAVRDFLGMPLNTPISKPEKENSARPVTGLQCSRSEVSGKRLWLEWAKPQYDTADAFFHNIYVHNYCPLMFMESSGRNRTPVQLKASERNKLNDVCDDALREVVKALQPNVVCGLGAFAEQRCKSALDGMDILVRRVLHPSPASPAANRGWASVAGKQIREAMDLVASGNDTEGSYNL